MCNYARNERMHVLAGLSKLSSLSLPPFSFSLSSWSSRDVVVRRKLRSHGMKIYYVKRALSRVDSLAHVTRPAANVGRHGTAAASRRNTRATFFGAVINQLCDVTLSESNGDKVALLEKKIRFSRSLSLFRTFPLSLPFSLALLSASLNVHANFL